MDIMVALGTIQVLRQHKGGWVWVAISMLMLADKVSGWVGVAK